MGVFTTLIGYMTDMLKTLWHLLGVAAKHWYISLPVAFAVVLLPFAVKFIVAAVSRLSFSVKLKAAVKKRGGICNFLRCPLVSLFVSGKSNDIKLWLDGEEYVLKFFPKNIRSKNVYMNSRDKAYVSRPFAQNLAGHGRFKGDPLKSDNIMNKGEGGQREVKLKLQYTEDCKYILLFEASPYNIFVLDKNRYTESGSGEVVDGEILYIGREFLNYIER